MPRGRVADGPRRGPAPGDESRRRGRDVDVPLETSRGDAAAVDMPRRTRKSVSANGTYGPGSRGGEWDSPRRPARAPSGTIQQHPEEHVTGGEISQGECARLAKHLSNSFGTVGLLPKACRSVLELP